MHLESDRARGEGEAETEQSRWWRREEGGTIALESMRALRATIISGSRTLGWRGRCEVHRKSDQERDLREIF